MHSKNVFDGHSLFHETRFRYVCVWVCVCVCICTELQCKSDSFLGILIKTGKHKIRGPLMVLSSPGCHHR